MLIQAAPRRPRGSFVLQVAFASSLAASSVGADVDPIVDTTPVSFAIELFVATPAVDVFFAGNDNDVDVDSVAPGSTRTVYLKLELKTPGGVSSLVLAAAHAFQGGARGFVRMEWTVLPVESSPFTSRDELTSRDPVSYGYGRRIEDFPFPGFSCYTRQEAGAYNDGDTYCLGRIPDDAASDPTVPAGTYGASSSVPLRVQGAGVDPGTLVTTIGIVPLDIIVDSAAGSGGRTHSIRYTASFPFGP